jgi:branched-chain amino acid transport system substrate-binding protein
MVTINITIDGVTQIPLDLRGPPDLEVQAMLRTLTVSILVVMTLAGAAGPASAQLAGQAVVIAVAGPLSGGGAGLGIEQKQAVELAVAEKNAAGGILGAQITLVAADDRADAAEGKAVAQRFCDDARVLGVIGHVNSGVSIEASNAYNACRLGMLTAMSSSPGVTDRGLDNVFRLTNRDDNKGPAIARHLHRVLGKRRAVVVDDQTIYGRGLADLFARAFVREGGEVVKRLTVTVGQTDFQPTVAEFPPSFDMVFFAGIAEAAPLLKEMRARGIQQRFACGDGCWDVKGFIGRADGAATQGEGVLILSAAPSVGRVPGSAEFAARYRAKYGPIASYAVNSYDSAHLLLFAIEAAAGAKGGIPTRGEVLDALRGMRFQGIAYARPVTWDAKGDNTAAVIFLNVVEGDHFKEIAEVSRDDLAR